MSKKLYIFLVFFLLFFTVNTYAAEEMVTVVSGFEKSYEVTFDTLRVVSGTAKEGTKVIVRQSLVLLDGTKSLQKVTIYTIGKTESFTDVIKLLVGLNEIEITGENGEKKQIDVYCIRKKDEKILEKLNTVSEIFNPSKAK